MPRIACLVLGAALTLTCACSGAGPRGQAGPPLHIGVDLPLTGPEARAAQPALNGVRFFVEQHPTLDGFAVSLVVTDDAQGGDPSPDQGAVDVQKLLDDPAAVAMIGPFDSAVARREIPVANEAGLGMVSPATSSPCLTRDIYLPALLNPSGTAVTCADAGLPAASALRPSRVNNYFRLSTTDDLQGPAAADYAFTRLKLVRAAVVSDHETYGQALAASFTTRFQKLGGIVVGRLDLSGKADESTSFLQRMKQAGAQALYFGGTSAGRGCTLRAGMASVFPTGDATPFLSGDGVADPVCIADAGSNAAGIVATAPIADVGADRAAARTVTAFRASYGRTTDFGPYTLLAYDATAILYAALHRAIQESGGRLPARADVVSQLTATSGFAGVTGTIGFDAAGDTTNRVVSVLEPSGDPPGSTWKVAGTIDYSGRLPY